MSVFAKDLFVGKTVLITGGGTGIGFAIAQTLGQLGARVIIAARDKDKLDSAAAQLNTSGISVLAGEVNIRDQESVTRLFDVLDKQGWQPDLLVNNAGGQFTSSALELSANGFRAVVDLNLQGTFLMSQTFARQRISLGRPGAVVNIVLCLEQGIPGMVHAAAARAGVVNLTKTLAWEWAEHGIRVNAVAPGTIETSGLDNYDANNLRAGIQRLPIKRMGQAAEVGEAVAYLASPAAGFITGITLPLDGGEHMTGANPQC